jgi:hypothetical protein
MDLLVLLFSRGQRLVHYHFAFADLWGLFPTDRDLLCFLLIPPLNASPAFSGSGNASIPGCCEFESSRVSLILDKIHFQWKSHLVTLSSWNSFSLV